MTTYASSVFGKNAVIALVSATLAFTPAFALATDPGEANSPATDTSLVAEDSGTYVDALTGLTDAERAELKSLYDKLDSLWQSQQALDLTEEEWDRITELEDKAYYASIAAYLTQDEIAELRDLEGRAYAFEEGTSLTDAERARLDQLQDKVYLGQAAADLDANELAELEALMTKEELTDEEWNRMLALEGKVLGYGTQHTEMSNADYVASLAGLTDAERTELCALYDKLDAYWAAADKCDLTAEEWERVAELEDKDYYAGIAAYLTQDELAELKGLWEAFDAIGLGDDLTDEQWNRIQELQDKIYFGQVAEKLDANELAEFKVLWDKVSATDQDEPLTDQEWERFLELEAKAEGAQETTLDLGAA